jgi:hypothetical protein
MLGVPEVKMLLAGGGAHFPFLPQILIDAAKKVAPKMTLTVIKVAPTPEISARWPHDLHDAFSQMATSMGGALLDVGKTT